MSALEELILKLAKSHKHQCGITDKLIDQATAELAAPKKQAERIVRVVRVARKESMTDKYWDGVMPW